MGVLSQTLESCKNKPGLKLYILNFLQRALGTASASSSKRQYTSIPIHNPDDEEGPLLNQQEEENDDLEESAVPEKPRQVLPFKRIWTKNVLCTLCAQAFFDFQMG